MSRAAFSNADSSFAALRGGASMERFPRLTRSHTEMYGVGLMRIFATVLSAAAALVVLSGCAYDRYDRYGYGRDGYRDGSGYNYGRNYDRNRNDRDRFYNRDRDDDRYRDRD